MASLGKAGVARLRFRSGLIPAICLLSILVLAAAVLTLAFSAPAQAAEYKWYPNSSYTFTWPSDAQWKAISTETEPMDGVAAQLDFVGDATYPGIYKYSNGAYLYFRIRVAYDGTVGASTYSDTIWVMLETNGDTDLLPEYAFAWDSKLTVTDHGLEMQNHPTIKPAKRWEDIQFDDFDENSSKKVLSPAAAPWDINLSGEGYVRTVDSVPVTNPSWGASRTKCTFVDIAVKWSYLKTQPLLTGGNWGIQVGSLANATDHNYIGGDVGRGASPGDPFKTTWGSPTLAVVSGFRAYSSEGHALVAWETVSEAGTAGFNLERADPVTGAWTRVNDSLIPALFEAPGGGSYTVFDAGAPADGSITYRLEEIELGGGTAFHGPYEVSPQGIAPYLPSLPADGAPTVTRTARVLGDPAAAGHRPASGSLATVGNTSTKKIRIQTGDPGLYVLRSADIALALGLSVPEVSTLISRNGLQLTCQGRPVAVTAGAKGSALYFYAQKLVSPYADNNVYWLAPGKATLMKSVRTSVSRGTGATSFVGRVHAEQDRMPATGLFHDPQADFWIWDYLSAGSTADTKIFELPAPDAVGGGTLTLSALGMTSTGVAGEHHALVELNGTVLGERTWSGTNVAELAFPVPAAALEAGTNVVSVRALLDAGVPYSIVAVDSLDLTYQRACLAVSDQLQVRAASPDKVSVSGLSSSTGWVLDLADPAAPQLPSFLTTRSSDGSVTLTFRATTAGREYLVATAAGAMQPLAMQGVGAATLTVSGKRGAEYLVVASPDMVGAASKLAAYRAGKGLKTAVVSTQQIYDEFSYGIPTPFALRSFLAYARSNWLPAPRYLVLAGEGSYDYKDHLGAGDSLVPGLLVDTPRGLAVSDNALADTSGDGLPDVLIGRIPALTSEELEAYVAKVRAYEADAGEWRSRVVVAADGPDKGGDFTADSRTVAALFPTGLSVQAAYLGEVGSTATRDALLDAFAGGSLFVNYLGHAGITQLAHEGLFTTSDIPGLSNTPRLPLVAAMTCVAGNFGLPTGDCLAEALTMDHDGGAIGVWAPTAMVMEDHSALLDQLMVEALFASHDPVLGQAVGSALAGFLGRGGPVSTAQTYALFGDPALVLTW